MPDDQSPLPFMTGPIVAMAPPTVVTVADPAGTGPEGTGPDIAAAGLGRVAAQGFAWNLAVTLLTKVVGFVASVLFARLLLKEDFGAYYEALVSLSLVAAVRDSAIAPVLVARQKELARWENSAFWMSTAVGLLGGLVLLAVGLRAAGRADGAVVARLLWLAALGSPLGGAGVVSSAKLQAQLRFALLAKLGLVVTLAVTGLSVLMAWCGCGAYSLLVPMLLGNVARAAVFLWAAPPTLRPRPELARGASLAAAGAMVAFSAFGWQVVGQADTLVVARHYGHDVVGLYGFAFGLSVQFVTLLSANVGSVLLPTLARFADDPGRQVNAYLRVCRALAAAGVPLCVMQALFARPLVQPVFGRQWAGSEAMLEILSVGMTFAVVNSFAVYVLQARQQWTWMVVYTLASTLLFLLFVNVGVRAGGANGVAAAVAVFHGLIGTACMWLVSRPFRGLSDVLRVFGPPLMAAAAGAAPVLTLPLFWPGLYHGQANVAVTLLAVSGYAAVFVGIYALVLRRLDPATSGEVARRLAKLRARFVPASI